MTAGTGAVLLPPHRSRHHLISPPREDEGMARPACRCVECQRTGAPTVFDGHAFILGSKRKTPDGRDVLARTAHVWRWVCTCGGGGQWTAQGSGVVYHGWRGHVERTSKHRK